MTEPQRTCRFRQLWTAALLLFSTIAMPLQVLKAADGHVVPSVKPEYWIVSSRHCPQRVGRYCRCCPLAYVSVGEDRCLYQKERCTFHRSLKPGAPICIVVHGSYTSWRNVVEESGLMYQWLKSAAGKEQVNVVFFTWPSEGKITILPQLDIGLLGRQSAFNGFYLAQLIAQLPEGSPVSLFGHSHGARTVASSMHLLAGGTVQGTRLAFSNPDRQRINVVFAGAAIDDNWLNPGERYGRALYRTEKLLNLRNREDIALRFYSWRKFFSGPALALEGFQTRNVATMGSLASKLWEIDVTRLIGTGHFWHNYYRRPEIASSIAPTLFYTDDDGQTPRPDQMVDSEILQQNYEEPRQPVRETLSNFTRSLPTIRR